MTSTVVVPEGLLKGYTAKLFEHAGMSAEHAGVVADALVWADLRGVDTHGVSRVGFYLNFIKKGVINMTPNLRVTHDTVALQIMDADASAGAVAMGQAVERAVEKARAVGLGLVLVRATTHTGALGYYTQQLAQQGMIGIAYSASIPMMAYHGTRVAGVSTAPLSIAAPGELNEPIVLDMASSVVSMGQLKQAKLLNKVLAEGLALDAKGNPTTDPQQAAIPLPFAGPKGSGLALMFEFITSLLVMNPLVSEFFSNKPGGRKHQQNACIIAIDAFRLCPEDTFRSEVARTVATLKNLPAREENGDILMPGERGHRTSAERRQTGIPLSAEVAQELADFGVIAGLQKPW
jgi:ureidoglycolate dehydrogenase (NAD+)